VNENAVETAKVTLMLARRLAHREAEKFWADHAEELPGQDTHSLEFERDLPLDNLDANILCADALFTRWPEVDAIIGNPPYLGSRYLAKDLLGQCQPRATGSGRIELARDNARANWYLFAAA
jgi:hypothetical protein